MNFNNNSIILRRVGVIISFFSLFLTVSVFEYCRIIDAWSSLFITVEIVSLLIFFLSSFLIYFKTGLLNFTHRSLEKLDEREITLTSKSLRISYAIFTVSVLILIMISSLSNFSIHLVTVVSLIIFAHLLPAAVIAWCEREV